MQGNELATWIDIAMKIGILIVAILALIKWYGYVDMKKKELHPVHEKKMGIPPKKDEIEKGSTLDSSKVFDQVLRKEDVVVNADEEGEDIPPEEFIKAVNQRK